MTEYIKFAPTITTTAVLIGGLHALPSGLLSQPIDTQQNHDALFVSTHVPSNALTTYTIPDIFSDATKNIETIHRFASNILENIEDLDPEFSRVIDENYWDLI